jgi:small subunit ribosomal protein S17
MRTKKGVITSAKMQGTVTVTVHRSIMHSLYGKRFRRSTKFLADIGEFRDLQEGDTVVITECRPLSKRKNFRVSDVLQRAPRVSELQEEAGLEEAMHRRKKTEEPAAQSSSAPAA